MKKLLKWAAVATAVLLIGIQFARPSQTNPPIDEAQTIQAKLKTPNEINEILERSCNDCHSNKTNWIWYGKVAPVSWFVTNHVNEGRGELNFSEWEKLSESRASRKLEEICEQVESGEMPIWNYVLLHPSAHLTDADKKTLCNWTKQEQAKIDANLTNSQ